MKMTDPVKSFVKNNSACASVFQELNIDFCCGGDVSLQNACEEKGLKTDVVYQRIMALKSSPSDEKDISGLTPGELTVHIQSTHHVYLKEALPRLTALMEKVCQAHSPRHPELKPLQTVFENLRADLEPHLLKEERVLFPLIVKLERDFSGLQMQAVAGPIRVMRHEHDEAGLLLKQMRTLANDYVAPEDGCQSFQLLYEELRKLEEDTHLHIHKENNLLFPAMERNEEVPVGF
ncbi:MAG: iron-sulfur cluster repair di-iron protein [Nitrospinae bacterium]|nr:iron-sulfur cluster repair di-iron protein [Nitrospinota bacterium]MBL7020818.1 iron-sulfur cluster repair di-iron protein [Nitrospinaceae bacterium]